MKRFQFRLQTVLQYRRQLEEQALARFQEALSQERDAERTLRELYDNLLDVCRAGLTGSDAPFRLSRDEFKRQLSVLISHQNKLLESLKKGTLERRKEYLEAKKESRILERLREKSWVAYQKDVERQEQQEMDELYLMKIGGSEKARSSI